MTATAADSALLLAMHAALDSLPSEHATRLELADLLEERGEDVLAAGQRWQAREARWPWRYAGAFAWFLPQAGGLGQLPEDLPRGLWDRLTTPPAGNLRDHRSYPSRRDAEDDLARALALETQP